MVEYYNDCAHEVYYFTALSICLPGIQWHNHRLQYVTLHVGTISLEKEGRSTQGNNNTRNDHKIPYLFLVLPHKKN